MSISNNATGYRPGVCTSTTRPTAPYEGQMIFETDTNRVLIWDNAAWVMIADTDTPPGMQLIAKGTTATGGSVDITGVFSSEFKNYRIIFTNIRLTTGADIRLRLRTDSATDTSGGYYACNIFASGASISAANENGQTSWRGVYTTNLGGEYNVWTVELQRPNMAKPTTVISQGSGWDGSTTVNRSYTGFLDNNTQYTGLTVFATFGNVTLDYEIYGYRF